MSLLDRIKDKISAVGKGAQKLSKIGQLKLNGQQYEGPVYVARNTKVHEVSFVAIGADQETDVSVAAAAQQEESEMSKQVDAAASSQTTAAARPRSTRRLRSSSCVSN